MLAALADTAALLEATLRVRAQGADREKLRLVLSHVRLPRRTEYETYESEEYALLDAIAAVVAVTEQSAAGVREFLRQKANRDDLEERASVLSPLRSRPEPHRTRVALASVLVIEQLALARLGADVDDAWKRAAATATRGDVLPASLAKRLREP